MGKPFYQVKDQLRKHHVTVCSSNYTLYDDMSRRVQDILRPLAQKMEVYSIDESFLYWKAVLPWYSLGELIRSRILSWTGLPVGVGFGPSKTLAKLANHLAKRGKGATGIHVLESEASITAALEAIELRDLWGVARGFHRRLMQIGINTPIQLRDADPKLIRDYLGVVGQRMVYELRGQSCITLETDVPDKQNICCSRSFGQIIGDLSTLHEAVTTFATQAAAKMRRQNLVADRVAVFVQTDRHAPVEQYSASWSARLTTSSDDTRLLCRCAAWCLSQIYRSQHKYKRAGVMLLDLCRRNKATMGLFDAGDPESTDRLMKAMDRINHLFGRHPLHRSIYRHAAHGISKAIIAHHATPPVGMNCRWLVRGKNRGYKYRRYGLP